MIMFPYVFGGAESDSALRFVTKISKGKIASKKKNVKNR